MTVHAAPWCTTPRPLLAPPDCGRPSKAEITRQDPASVQRDCEGDLNAPVVGDRCDDKSGPQRRRPVARWLLTGDRLLGVTEPAHLGR